jgi:hypothetical protein
MRSISVGKNLAAGVETVVYTVPTGYTAIWTLCYAHNSLGTNKTLSIDWYDTSANTHVAILDQLNFTAKMYYQLNAPGTGVMLEEGDQVHMTTESGSAFGIICTFELEKKTGI